MQILTSIISFALVILGANNLSNGSTHQYNGARGNVSLLDKVLRGSDPLRWFVFCCQEPLQLRARLIASIERILSCTRVIAIG